MVQGNQSWKQKLKNIIDNTLKNSESFEDFLIKIKAQDIEIKYKDYVKKSGKCLGFKMPGQKYFIYAEKLGWYYEEAQIRTRIDRVNQRKTESLSRKTTRKMFDTDNRLKSLFDLSEDRFNSYGMHRWGTIENLKQGFKTLNYLKENGFKNAEEFLKKYSELSARKMQNHEQINSIEKKMNHTAYRLKYLRIYREYKPINDRYRKAVFQDKFFRKFDDSQDSDYIVEFLISHLFHSYKILKFIDLLTANIIRVFWVILACMDILTKKKSDVITLGNSWQ